MKYLWLLLAVFFLPGAVRAQYDSTYYHRTTFELGKETGMEGTTVRVPFRISGEAYNGLELAPWTFGVMYDDAALNFQSITLAAGNPYQSLPLTWWPIPGGLHVGMEQPVIVYDTATLFYLEFEILSIDDTACVDLDIVNWYFNGGRVRPELRDGELCMVPIPPRPKGSMEMPRELTWVRSKRDYVPNPFTVRALIKNEGGDVAKRVMFKIDYDPAAFELVSPITDIQQGSHFDVDSNESSVASWQVRALPRLTGDSVTIAVTAMFDNHPDIVMYQKMWIQPTEPVLLCSIDPVQVTADYENERYTPMPFDLIVHVTNDGRMATDSVYARIEIPPVLTLAGDDAPNRTSKKVDPGRLLPSQSGEVSWSLSCPLFENDTSFIVQVWVRTSNADSSLCEALVHLPAMGVPSLRAADHCPGQLMFNDSTGLYEPNPFEVSITAVNLAKTPANNVTAYLYLPDGVVLDPPGQSLRQEFGTLERWQTGDPIPTRVIRVRWDRMYRYNTVAGFKWAIGGVNSISGLPLLDTIWAYSETDIPGVKPYYYSKIIGPPHIAWDDSNNCYVPNPFTVRLTIFNSSHTTGTIERMELYYPNDGIQLDTSVQGNTEVRHVHQLLLPGDSVWAEWVLHIDPRLDGRNIDLSMNAFDDEGNPLGGGRRIVIPGVKTCLGYRDNNSTHLVDYDSSLQLYTDRRITFSHGLYNCGEWTYNNPWIELTLDDPEGYLVYDTAFANPQRVTADKLSPGDTLYGTWHLRLAKPNVTGQQVVIPYEFHFGVDGRPAGEPDGHYLRIEPAMVVGIDEPTQPGGIALSQNYPNPFNPTTEIEYAIPQATHVLLRAFDALGREVAVLVNEWKAPGAYRVAFDATDLPAGTYVYRLETGQGVLSKKLVVLK